MNQSITSFDQGTNKTKYEDISVDYDWIFIFEQTIPIKIKFSTCSTMEMYICFIHIK